MIHIYKDTLQTAQNVVTPSTSNVPKMPHVEPQELSEKMSKGQREGIRLWNDMRSLLLQAGLMEEK